MLNGNSLCFHSIQKPDPSRKESISIRDKSSDWYNFAVNQSHGHDPADGLFKPLFRLRWEPARLQVGAG
jgi:hypothetical protein